MAARKIVLAMSIGVGVTLSLAGGGLAVHASRALEAERVREMELVGRQARAVAGALAPELGAPRAAAAASEGLEASFGGRWRWVALDGAFAAGLAEPEQRALARGEAVVQRLDGGQARVLTPLPPGVTGERLVLELTDSLDDLRGPLAGPVRVLFVALAVSVLAVVLLSTLAGHVLIARPLRAVARFVKAVEEGDLSGRLRGSGRGELAALERALNQLCDRLQAADRAVTEQARAAARAAEELRRAEHLGSVGKLAAGVAHELGTPLNVILVRARALTRAPQEAPEVARQATIIAEQAERLTRIVRQLLDFSRRRPAHLGSLDPAQLVRSVTSLLEPQARAKEVTLSAEVPGAVPSLRADAGQLEQVLTNLVMNAIQASHGGGAVVVRCATDRAAPPADLGGEAGPGGPVDVVRIDVEDAGVGVPREHLDRLFEPFFTTKPPGEGTGLGLSVSWGIVREHGGWISVESRELEGSRFSVLLPARREEVPA